MMKKIFVLLILSLQMTSQSWAACGPPLCCTAPHQCGEGPEIENFQATEEICMIKAAQSVRGKVYPHHKGYPFSIRNDLQLEMAQVSWFNGICWIKYNPGYFRK